MLPWDIIRTMIDERGYHMTIDSGVKTAERS